MRQLLIFVTCALLFPWLRPPAVSRLEGYCYQRVHPGLGKKARRGVSRPGGTRPFLLCERRAPCQHRPRTRGDGHLHVSETSNPPGHRATGHPFRGEASAVRPGYRVTGDCTAGGPEGSQPPFFDRSYLPEASSPQG